MSKATITFEDDGTGQVFTTVDYEPKYEKEGDRISIPSHMMACKALNHLLESGLMSRVQEDEKH